MIQRSSNYKIIPKYNLVVEQYNGEFTLPYLIDLKSKEERDENYNPSFNMIMDLSKVNIKLSKEEFDEFISIMDDQKRLLKMKRVAVITQTPDQYVKTYLILEQTKLPIELTLVSSIEAALVWLNYNDVEIREIIEEHKSIFT